MNYQPLTSEQFISRIEDWISAGGEFPDLGYRRVETLEEAEAIVRALKNGDIDWARNFRSNIHCIAFLLQTEKPIIGSYFRENAAATLRRKIRKRILTEILSHPEGNEKETNNKRLLADSYLFALQALMRFGYHEDTDLLIQVAREPYYGYSPQWSSIFNYVRNVHPEPAVILEALREPLPQNFCKIAFLDFSNDLCFQNRVDNHPFDTDRGFEFLLELLEREEDSYAKSVARSSPFLNKDRAFAITENIRKHKLKTVRQEVDWAKSRRGGNKGKKFLLREYQKIQPHSKASKYLSALGHELPHIKARNEIQFKSLVDYSDWMAHEEDFWGYPPKKIKVIGEQIVNWPSSDQTLPFWQVSYETKDPYDGSKIKGISLVSPVGFSRFFAEDKESAFQEAVAFDKSYKPFVDRWPDWDWCLKRLKELNPKIFK